MTPHPRTRRHLRAATTTLLAATLLATTACTTTTKKDTFTATKTAYTVEDVKGAYYTAKDATETSGEKAEEYLAGLLDSSHVNYIPPGGVQTCPYVHRSETADSPTNVVEPTAGEPVGRFIVAPARPKGSHLPNVSQGALYFATDVIADTGMDEVAKALAECPSSYNVNGGPAAILGKYSVSTRPLEMSGWAGYVQQLAHTYPLGQDDVYYDDMATVVLHRANIILYVDVSARKIIGDRSEAASQVKAIVKAVLERLG